MQDAFVIREPLQAPATPPKPLDRRSIERLVEDFYGAVRADALLGPVFDAAIGARWPQHLVRKADFWATVMLGSGGYRGNVMQRHLDLPTLGAQHVERWLELWQTPTTLLFEPAAAARLQSVAQGIARMILLARERQQAGAAPVRGA